MRRPQSLLMIALGEQGTAPSGVPLKFGSVSVTDLHPPHVFYRAVLRFLKRSLFIEIVEQSEVIQVASIATAGFSFGTRRFAGHDT